MNITVQKLHEIRNEGEEHTLLDIREEEELAIASIDGTVHIPMITLPVNLEKLPKDHPIAVMCHVGGRSTQVHAWLISNGYDNAMNLE